MAKLPAAFSTENQAELGDFDPIPRGDYVAHIIESEMLDTKAGDGSYLKLTYQILDGEHRERLLWSNLNLDNPNAKAVEIAYKHLTSLCKALGITNMGNDSEVLHGKPVIIKVTVKPGNAEFGPQNSIKGYEPYTGSAPTPIERGEATPSSKAAASASSGKKPWEK
jgi:hypothetical protein